MKSDQKPIHVIGGGLAGSEASWQLASAGIPVILHEMRPIEMTPAHKSDGLAELVCSNSFRSDDAVSNAVGVLHAEMRLAGSLIMEMGDSNQVPAGGALAVDRDGFSDGVTARLHSHPLIEVETGLVGSLPPPEWGTTIIATGPLTAAPLAESLRAITGEDALAFFDAIAPIVHRDSIDMDKAWFQSRYDKVGPGGTGADYINCPLDKEQYEAFVDALLAAETAEFRDWEKDTPYFDGCLPIEVMASRGRETLRHGPMKPRGLTNAHKPEEKAYAVVQLRQDNALATLYNIVGFQTKMKYGAQIDILRAIPGLEGAEFARLGGLHRNTFLNSPKLLDQTLRLKAAPHLRFAGQMTGCEGYVESAAIGLLAARFTAAECLGLDLDTPPETSAHGALLAHITGGHISVPESDDDFSGQSSRASKRSFQPMNINFGLFPPMETPSRDEDGKRIKGKSKTLARRQAIARRALEDFQIWAAENTRKLAA